MATSSLTKQFVITDEAAYERLIKILEAPAKTNNDNKESQIKTSVLEEGRNLFLKSFSR